MNLKINPLDDPQTPQPTPTAGAAGILGGLMSMMGGQAVDKPPASSNPLLRDIRDLLLVGELRHEIKKMGSAAHNIHAPESGKASRYGYLADSLFEALLERNAKEAAIRAKVEIMDDEGEAVLVTPPPPA